MKSIFKDDSFKYKQTCREDKLLKFILENRFNHKNDTIQYKMNVIKDAYPTIEVAEQTDSISEGLKYFKGITSDDYGLKSLQFVYKIIRENGQNKEVRMPVQQVVGSQMNFTFAVDFKREDVQLNDKIEYYFVVYDNDGVNGSKAAKSQLFTYELPTLEELNDIHEKMHKMVEQSGGEITAVFFCPHKTEDHCNCRKPMPGMIFDICDRFNVENIANVMLIGDSDRDLEAIHAAGGIPVLVKTGNGKKTLSKGKVPPGTLVFENLLEVSEYLMAKDNE
jgi:histidinol-phosphate phosphatase family protein